MRGSATSSRVARGLGAYVSAAHPSFGPIAWRFKPEMVRPDSRPDGYEVWTGPFQTDDEQSVRDWDAMLQQGWRVHANGGSDLHGTENNFGFRFGTPTTVVYAPRLAQPDLIAALRAGRSFVTRRPDGVECYLTGDAGRLAHLRRRHADRAARASRRRSRRWSAAAGGMRLVLIAGTGTVSTTPLTEDEQVVRAPVPVPGYVRAEVRGTEAPGPARQAARVRGRHGVPDQPDLARRRGTARRRRWTSWRRPGRRASPRAASRCRQLESEPAIRARNRQHRARSGVGTGARGAGGVRR